MQSDRKVPIGGGFTTVNGRARSFYARLIGPPAIPTVTHVTPASGITAGGTVVTITGTGFNGATAVTFGGVAVASFKVIDDTTITATTAAGQAGTASVLVTTPSGTNAANTHFSWVPAITFDAPAQRQVGDPSFDLTATSFAGLPVTFQIISGPATLDGSTVTSTGDVGVVHVRATQAADPAFDPTPFVDFHFHVVPVSTRFNLVNLV